MQREGRKLVPGSVLGQQCRVRQCEEQVAPNWLKGR